MFLCHLCGEIYQTEQNLEVHVEAHLKIGFRNYGGADSKCKPKEKILKQKKMSTERPHKCDICKKGFKLPHHMRAHRIGCSGEKPFKCVQCGKGFSLQTTLTTHLRIHTGEKPYKCEVCENTFTRRNGLRRHILIHTGKRPYQCDVCGKKFIQKGNLKTHGKVHAVKKKGNSVVRNRKRCKMQLSKKDNSAKIKRQLRSHYSGKATNTNGFSQRDNLKKPVEDLTAANKSKMTSEAEVTRSTHSQVVVDSQEDSSDLFCSDKHSDEKFFTKLLKVACVSRDLNYVIEKLCKRLQYHPLALHLAAAYINEDMIGKWDWKVATENFLVGIEEKAKALDTTLQNKYDKQTIPEAVCLIWKLVHDKMKTASENGERMIQLMKISSFLSPKGISLQFLFNIIQQANPEASLNENILEQFKIFSAKNGEHDRLISVDPIVQKITRHELKKDGEYPGVLGKILENVQKMLEENRISMVDIVHVEFIWKHAIKISDIIKKFPKLPTLIYNTFEVFGKYKEAYEFCCHAVSVLESALTPNNQWTLRIKSQKGSALYNLGKYADSFELLMEVYEEQKKLFKDEDDDCLWTANLIGVAYHGLKKYNEAKLWYQSTLERIERINGNEHPMTLSVKKNLAVVLSIQEKYAEATKIYKEVLEVEERLNGPEHRKTLITKNNLAFITFSQKSYEEALKMFTGILRVRQRILGLDHPKVLTTKDWIATTYKSLGRAEEAFKLAKDVYEKRVTVLGPEHPETIDSKLFLRHLKI